MQMIPATPYGTHSQAEKRVFDQLRMAFPDNPDLTAYHSLNLPRHDYKRFGEIDFLICGNEGIYVLEVKGGGIGCVDGVWHYTNRYGDISTSLEGPFRQAESALHGLISKMRNHLPDWMISSFAIGFGVVFPDCELRVQGAEWDPNTVADARVSKNLERWLGKLFEYWQRKEIRRRRPDRAVLQAVKHYLRPEFETAIPLFVQVARMGERAAALTEDQMVMVDVVAANYRVLCSGGAGTGKTFLAMELARRWTAEGKNVLLACRSPWLKRHLESRLSFPGLTVTLAESAGTAARRIGIDRFDALIVDEGQDLFDLSSLEHLDAVLKGGLTHGRWCIFHDVNNQAGLFGDLDRKALTVLEGCTPARVPLRTNCRNTRTILEKVQSTLGADMGVRGIGEGPGIREYSARSRVESADYITREIQDMVDPGGLSYGEITILSPYPFESSSASAVPGSVHKHIAVLDEYSLRSFPPDQISFAEISSFKGLENEVVIVIDLPYPIRGNGSHSLHYVAMSRARTLLVLIYISR